MQYTINELRQKLFGHILDVYGIFQDFFGELFTDLQGVPTEEELTQNLLDRGIGSQDGKYEVSSGEYRSIKRGYSSVVSFILVWWPRVTVTNENDKSVQIQDLYAKVKVNIEGRIPYEYRGFKLTRTTFPETQYASGYMHSHVPRFSEIPSFEYPCLGSGPINNTIMDLKNGYEQTLWMLFCQELSLYVTVESLTGGPYIRLENIGADERLYGYDNFNLKIRNISDLSDFWPYGDTEKRRQFMQMLKAFTLYYLQKGHLSLSYKDGKFIQGMPYFDYMVDISNSFIEFFNEYGSREAAVDLYDRKTIVPAKAANNQFYRNDSNISHHDYALFEGQNLFVFKGEMKQLHIEQEEERHTETILLLNTKIAMFILYNVLKIINYRYRNEYNSKHTGNSSGELAPANQTVLYL